MVTLVKAKMRSIYPFFAGFFAFFTLRMQNNGRIGKKGKNPAKWHAFTRGKGG